MLYYITSNKEKIMLIEKYLKPHDIDFTIKSFPFIEIQSEHLEDITLDKATKAFEVLQTPLIVADHGWSIAALNGFPGPYMKYVNDWFTPQNYLDLLDTSENRRVLMTEVVRYMDKNISKEFILEHEGVLLRQARGNSSTSIAKIAVFEDNRTIAESVDHGDIAFDSSPLWQEFASWYKTEVISKLSPQPSR